MQEEVRACHPTPILLKGNGIERAQVLSFESGKQLSRGFFSFSFLGGGGDKRENSNGKQYFQSAPFK